MKKIAVIGSRNFNDYELLARTLDAYLPFTLLSGGAKGADSLAERYAEAKSYEKVIYRPDWKRHKQGAGIRRNEVMIDAADEVVAFWDGESKGTAMAIERAEKNRKPVRIVRYKAPEK